MKKKIYYIVLAGMVACGTVFSAMPRMSPVQSTRASDTESALYEKIDDQAERIAKLQESIDELTRQKKEGNKEEETEEKKEETVATQSTPTATEQMQQDDDTQTEELQQKTEENTKAETTGASNTQTQQTQQQTSAIVSVPAELPKDADKERELVEKINEQAKAIQDQSDTIKEQSDAIKQANQNIEDLKNRLTEVQETQQEQQDNNIEIPTGTEINAERVSRYFDQVSDLPDAPLSMQPTTCDKFLDGLTDAEREAYRIFADAVERGTDNSFLNIGYYDPYTEFRPDAFYCAVDYTIFRYVHCSYSLFHGTPQADGKMNWYIFMKTDLHRAWLVNQQQAKVVQAVADKIVTPGITEKGAVLRFQDWISMHLTYLTDNYNPGTSIYLSYGNCQSYAQLFAEMCNYVGIPCYCVLGDSTPDDNVQRMDHIWNRAYVGGEWYYFDLCWSDNDEENDPYNLNYMFSKEPFSGREIIDFTSHYFDYGK